MNSLNSKYQALLQDILDNGVVKGDQTGTGEYYYEKYQDYYNNWLKENPPFSGPYSEHLMTYDEFVTELSVNPSFASSIF